MIVMEFDLTSNFYVLYVRVLMSAKDKYLYDKFLHAIIDSLNYRWLLKVVVVDFKKAFLKAVYQLFPPMILFFSLYFMQYIQIYFLAIFIFLPNLVYFWVVGKKIFKRHNILHIVLRVKTGLYPYLRYTVV
ncbi:hypothetical protein MXB_324 [Myxobolus squamalis]|nr:hypothetical protein MXB_324 [Myxobolus squamalis]